MGGTGRISLPMARCPHVLMNRKVLRKHQRPNRHFEREILAHRARPLRPLPVLAAFGAMFGMKAILHERVDVRAGDEIHGAAVPAVAAVGSAARDELLPAEAHRAAAAITSGYFDFDFVNKHEMWRV